jgi:hypothetical protein
MKIALLTVCRNERQHLPDFIRWNTPLADVVYAYDDNSSDETRKILEENDIDVIGGNYSFFKSEMLVRSTLLKHVKNKTPDIDWFIFLDADELLLCDRHELEELLTKANQQKCSGVRFHLINLWRSSTYYRIDSSFDDVRKVHAWKNSSKLTFKVETGLHKQLHPHSISRILDQEMVRIIHLGFSSSPKIIRKFLSYRNLGQRGASLWRIIDENRVRVKPVKSLKESIGSNFDEWYQYQEEEPGSQKSKLIETIKGEWSQHANLCSSNDAKAPQITLISLIYQGVEWLEFIYGEMLKIQSELEDGLVEILFCANDASEEVKNYLIDNFIPHFVYENDDPNEHYISRVYRAYNEAVKMSNGRYTLLINSDMAFCPAFLTILLQNQKEDSYQVGKLIESGALKPDSFAIKRNFGKDLKDFNQRKFKRFVDNRRRESIEDGGLFMPTLVYKSRFLELGGFPEGNITPNCLDEYIKTGDYEVAKPGEKCISGDAAFILRAKKLGLDHKTNNAAMVYHFQEGEKRNPKSNLIESVKSGINFGVDNLSIGFDRKNFEQSGNSLHLEPRLSLHLRGENHLEILAARKVRKGKKTLVLFELSTIKHIDQYDGMDLQDNTYWVNEKFDTQFIEGLIAKARFQSNKLSTASQTEKFSIAGKESEIEKIILEIFKSTFVVNTKVSVLERVFRRLKKPKLVKYEP